MKKIILVLLFILSLSQTKAQVSWELQNTVFPTGYSNVTGISNIDDNNVWAYSNNTTTFKIGFSKTTNGTSWTSAGVLDYGSENSLTAFEALSTTRAFMLFVNTIDFSTGSLLYTNNSGSTWAVGLATATFPDFVHFFDANNGVIVCDSSPTTQIIYKTIDGGTNWNLVAAANLPTFISDEFFLTKSYRYYQNSMWFTTNKGRFFKSNNQGTSWVAVQSPYTTGYLGTAASLNAEFTLVDSDTAYILNGTGQISKTINGGLSWTNISNTSNTGAQNLCKIPSTNILVSNGTTNSKYSTNEGLNWTVIDNTFRRDLKSTGITATWTLGGNNLYKLDASTLNVFSNINKKVVLSIYPNPSNNFITIDASESISKINIIDILGKKTKITNFENNTIDVSNLQNGVYFIEINTDKGSFKEKFIKN